MVHGDRSLFRGEVEVDEAFIGGLRSGKRGRGAEGKELVVIAAECSGKKGVGRMRIQRVPDASTRNLETFILANIEPGSTIHTHGWKSYNDVGSLGYKDLPKKISECRS